MQWSWHHHVLMGMPLACDHPGQGKQGLKPWAGGASMTSWEATKFADSKVCPALCGLFFSGYHELRHCTACFCRRGSQGSSFLIMQLAEVSAVCPCYPPHISESFSGPALLFVQPRWRIDGGTCLVSDTALLQVDSDPVIICHNNRKEKRMCIHGHKVQDKLFHHKPLVRSDPWKHRSNMRKKSALSKIIQQANGRHENRAYIFWTFAQPTYTTARNGLIFLKGSSLKIHVEGESP